MKASLVQSPETIDHTPSSAVSAGDVVVIGSMLGIASLPIAADALGALNTVGIFDVAKVTGAITVGARIYWDPTGDPEGGDAGTGAATTSGDGLLCMGIVTVAAVSADETVRVLFVQTIGGVGTAAAVADAAALTIENLTDDSGGTAATTIAAITEAASAGSADTAPVKNAIATLAAQQAKTEADLAALRTPVNAVLAALRGLDLIAEA